MSDTKVAAKKKGSGKKEDYSDLVDGLQNVLPGIPDRPSKSLMTYEELQQKFGAAPKKDRLGGLWKMSVRYKDIVTALGVAQAMLDGVTLGQVNSEDGRAAFEQKLDGQLDDVVAACAAYFEKHKKKPGNVEGLVRQANALKASIGPTLDNLLDGGADDLPQDLHIDQAIAAKRLGIKPDQLKGVSPRHCNFADINDNARQADPVLLGKGKVNSVHLIKHGGIERVFKEEQQQDKSGAWAPSFMGIDSQADPRYGNRNIASGTIGTLLGTKVVPQASFGVSAGKVGLVMDKAPGDTLQALLKAKKINPQTFSPKAMASLQRQLADLEACDIIAGQADRHAGNYLVDVQGDEVIVTAIDNDFAFPDRSKAIGRKDVPMGFRGMNSIPNLPDLMDRKIADNILKINFDRDMRPQFDGVLTGGEIETTAKHVEAMQEHVRKLERTGCIVTNWETWRSRDDNSTATEFLGRNTTTSMFGRDLGRAVQTP